MQIFPFEQNFTTSSGNTAVNRAAGKLLQGGGAFFLGKSDSGQAPSFERIFSGLSEYNQANRPGIPSGFASVKDDNSLIKGRHIRDLGRNLLNKGVDQELVDDLLSRINSEAGFPGIGRILGFAGKQERKGDPLDEQESMLFNGMLQRLGFSADEIADLETMAQEGNGGALLHKLQAGFKDGAHTLGAKEAEVLARALDLSPELSRQLKAAFGQNEELMLNGRAFNTLMAPAAEEFSRRQASASKLAAELPQAIADMLEKAALEKNADITASNRGSRKSDRSELLMRDGATSKDNEAEGAKKQSIVAALLSDRDGVARSNEEAMNDAEHREQSDEGQARHKFLLTSDAKDTEESVQAKQVSADKAAFAVRTEFAAGSAPNAQPQPGQQPQAGNAGQPLRHDARIFEQVQQGIIKNAVDGSSNITLRLDPPELGKLTLSLTVLNGEIKALIRTDKVETTTAVSEQLQQLKASLEEQGFKVTNIEVETRPQNSAQQDAWSSAEQHNLEQEAREKARLLQLARTRTENGETLARNLQNDVRQATIAAEGLHIIA